MSKIEQVIMEMEEYIESCKSVPFSSNKITVEKDAMLDLISELRLRTPEEIKKYQKIITNKDAILADAKEQADGIIAQAQARTEQLINEHEIMQRAVASANEYIQQAQEDAQNILDQATMDANNIRMSAVQYTDDLMADLQLILEHTIESSRSRFDSLLMELNKTRDIVISNRNELRPQQAVVEPTVAEPQIMAEEGIPEPELVAPDVNVVAEEAAK